jgi:hypothetical protein
MMKDEKSRSVLAGDAPKAEPAKSVEPAKPAEPAVT